MANNTISTTPPTPTTPPNNPQPPISNPPKSSSTPTSSTPLPTQAPPNAQTIQKIDQVTSLSASQTVDFFVTYATTQTVIDGKSTEILATQTFAAIRPRFAPSSAGLNPSMLFLVMLLLKLF
eukprot:NODE_55_length_29507_cov_0.809712.p25 type:complete len:122 gc:universal NODE_55_length_29507_cov_0.809712:19506-19141(-)